MNPSLQKIARSTTRAALTHTLMDVLPELLDAHAAAVAWYGDGQRSPELLFRGIPSPVIQHYESCASEVDVVQAEACRRALCTDDAMLFSDAEWGKTSMYQEVGRPAGVRHHLVSPIIADGRVAGVMSVARREHGPAFSGADREAALGCSIYASEAFARIRLSTKMAGANTANVLTAREMQVAELITTGSSNKQIAAALCISENTVKSSLKRIFVKLSITSRVELAVSLSPPGTAAVG
jgi:DNA-binding CsgD family transcriptional regulator